METLKFCIWPLSVNSFDTPKIWKLAADKETNGKGNYGVTTQPKNVVKPSSNSRGTVKLANTVLYLESVSK